jgi:CDGSH-type Zn-finger protein
VAGVSKVSALRQITEVVVHHDGGGPSTFRSSSGPTFYDPIILERGRWCCPWSEFQQERKSSMPTKKKSKQQAPRTACKIRVSKNGPYLVSGRVPLAKMAVVTDAEGYAHGWRVEKEYPAQENYALCRCGRSRNMPFCDGTHARVHFDGTETASREAYLDRAEETTGPALELTDVRELCMGAGFCHRAGGIRSLTEESDDPQARQIAIEEAGDCPSGRLVVWDENGNPIEPGFQPSIASIEDPERGMSGPIWVRGGIPIEFADGAAYEIRNRVTLCSCGKSMNKPFCDGSHVYED